MFSLRDDQDLCANISGDEASRSGVNSIFTSERSPDYTNKGILRRSLKILAFAPIYVQHFFKLGQNLFLDPNSKGLYFYVGKLASQAIAQ
jgi:hypothetical protein